MAIQTPVIGETVRIKAGKYNSDFAGVVGEVLEQSRDCMDLLVALPNGSAVWMTQSRIEFGRGAQ